MTQATWMRWTELTASGEDARLIGQVRAFFPKLKARGVAAALAFVTPSYYDDSSVHDSHFWHAYLDANGEGMEHSQLARLKGRVAIDDALDALSGIYGDDSEREGDNGLILTPGAAFLASDYSGCLRDPLLEAILTVEGAAPSDDFGPYTAPAAAAEWLRRIGPRDNGASLILMPDEADLDSYTAHERLEIEARLADMPEDVRAWLEETAGVAVGATIGLRRSSGLLVVASRVSDFTCTLLALARA